jgi:hypothetical protein
MYSEHLLKVHVVDIFYFFYRKDTYIMKNF